MKPHRLPVFAFLVPVTACSWRQVPAKDFATPGENGPRIERLSPSDRFSTPIEAPVCGIDISPYLESGETVLDRRCRFGYEHLLTDRALLRVDTETITEGKLTLRLQVTRTDMLWLRPQGLAAWQPTETEVFVLTKDGNLIRLPHQDPGPTVASYSLGFDTSTMGRDSMAYQSGILFLAPHGMHAMAMTFGEERRIMLLHLRSSLPDAGFFHKGTVLVYGKPGVEETEVQTTGGLDGLHFRTTKRLTDRAAKPVPAVRR